MSDSEEDEDFALVQVDFEHDFTMVRLIENTFLPSRIKLTAELIPSEELDDEKFGMAVTKIRFWLEGIVSRCIAFGKGNEDAQKMLISSEGRNHTGNLLMLTPFEPTDEHFAALMQAKMSALGGGDLIVGDVTVRSNNMQGLAFRFVGNSESIFPEMAEWIGERSFFETPWWVRDDASTLDVSPPDDADLTVKPAWAYSLDFLAQVRKPQQDVVLKPDFRPTVIEGGQKDDEDDEE